MEVIFHVKLKINMLIKYILSVFVRIGMLFKYSLHCLGQQGLLFLENHPDLLSTRAIEEVIEDKLLCALGLLEISVPGLASTHSADQFRLRHFACSDCRPNHSEKSCNGNDGAK